MERFIHGPVDGKFPEGSLDTSVYEIAYGLMHKFKSFPMFHKSTEYLNGYDNKGIYKRIGSNVENKLHGDIFLSGHSAAVDVRVLGAGEILEMIGNDSVLMSNSKNSLDRGYVEPADGILFPEGLVKLDKSFGYDVTKSLPWCYAVVTHREDIPALIVFVADPLEQKVTTGNAQYVNQSLRPVITLKSVDLIWNNELKIWELDV